MRARLPIAVVVLTMLFALAATGCGDDKTTSGGGDVTSATGVTDSGFGAANGTTSANAKTAYDQCMMLSKDVQDSAQRKQAEQRCKDGYEDLKKNEKQAQKEIAEAKANCKAEANKLPDGAGKTSALAACEQIQ